MNARAPYDARAVANLLLDFATEAKASLTQVSLLKLIYFAHGWYLAKTGSRLVRQDFEAWKYGPVIKVVRDEFKSFGARAITARATKLDIYSGQRSIVAPELSADDVCFVRSIYNAYHVYDAWQLSHMTHEKGSPWDLIWNSDQPIGRLGLRLKDDEIKAHFDSVPKRFRLS